MTKVYLAARYTRRLELCDYRDQLTDHGYTVNSRWLDGFHQLSDTGTPIGDAGELLVESGDEEHANALRQKFALDDRDDVMNAHLLIAFTEMPRVSNSRGGRHVELGIAIGQQKPIVIVGPRENVFCWLPGVVHFDSWDLCLAGLSEVLP